MKHTKLVACASGAVLAFTLACSQNAPAPAAPGGAEPGVTDAAPDGSTLKVTAPTPQSPVNNAQPDLLVLTAGASSARFADGVPLSYEFEIKNAAGATVCTHGPIPASGATVSVSPTCTLEFEAAHTWRVRAVNQGSVGPWSAAASFRAPSGGYIRGNEVFDPLTNERTVGEIVGSVTFIPGVGVRLNDFTSHIRYRLPETLYEGEFSLIITGLATNNEGHKTKVMAMSEGLSDIVTNDRRMSVEKRGDPAGIIAWRFITHGDQTDTVGAERVRREFDPGQAYLWTASWNGFFRVRVQRGGASGPTIYDMGKPYQGRAYDPNPHYAFIGAPIGRTGAEGATVPGMIVRNVWISPRPRPASIGQ